MPTTTDPATLLADITHALTTIEATINAIDAEIKRLRVMGIFADTPRQVWEDKFGNDYLYLIFPSLPSGGYTGPNGKRKVYIGRQPNAVAKAEAMIARTNQVITLRHDFDNLITHRRRLLSDLMSAQLTAQRPPRLSGPIPYQ